MYGQSGIQSADIPKQKYAVFFKDKPSLEYTIFEPQKYLSDQSIERRLDYGILLDDDDLPVHQEYISSLLELGVEIYAYSKWENLVILDMAVDLEETVKDLPFVTSIKYVGKTFYESRDNRRKIEIPRRDFTKYETVYGGAYNQISIMNGEYLHRMGYRGEGRTVSVLDGGFINVQSMPFFDSLRLREGMLDIWDVTENDDWVYENSTHGTEVLSTMASNIPGLMVGTAPDANYALYMTEYVASEYQVEEYNWMIGAERADSLGTHLINSSLGYTSFDSEGMDYTYEQLDGNTAICTNAADLASKKGILVVNSAGNSGNDGWKYIGAPADADSILTVGAVNHKGNKVGFSSYGPSADGRVKPTVSAVGKSTVVASINSYGLSVSDGTSFSSPVMCGMTAALWSAFPEKTNMEIIDAVTRSSTLANEPDYKLGHGVPNMLKAYIDLFDSSIDDVIQTEDAYIFPLVNQNKLEIFKVGVDDTSMSEVVVANALGDVFISSKLEIGDFNVGHMSAEGFLTWPSGLYSVTISSQNAMNTFHFVKN